MIADDGACTLREAIIAANTDTSSGASAGECIAGNGADAINVPAGTFTLAIGSSDEDAAASGDLDITEELTISGAGAGNTIIEAGTAPDNGIDRVFDIPEATNVDVNITGVTIRHGLVDGNGGGIRHEGDGTLSVTSSTISNNSTLNLGDGGGIRAGGNGPLVVTNSTISNNSSDDEGGGIESDGDGSVTITNSVISGNSALDEGGGIEMDDNGPLTLTDSQVTGNTAINDEGGGINSDHGASVTITGSTLSGNTAGDAGGGISFDDDGTGSVLTVTNTTISGNTAVGDGGGIYHLGGANVIGSTISGNSTGIDGGGIASDGPLTVQNTTLDGNTAADDGGGINVSDQGSLTLTGSTVSNNEAGDVGGGVRTSSDMTLTDVTISGNSAEDGGGIFTKQSTAVLTRVNITGNTADDGEGGGNGGGIFIRSSSMTLSLVDSSVAGNSAGDHGGGIFNQGVSTVEVTRSTVSGNTAGEDGGGIYNAGSVLATDSTLSGNTAGGIGGGIYTGISAEGVELTNVTVSGNQAGAHGGGIYHGNGDGTVLLTNVTVALNEAKRTPTEPNGIEPAEYELPGGAGIFTDGSGNFELLNTIVGNNLDEDCVGPIASLGHNLDSDGTCGLGQSGDLSGMDPQLGPLADNGGATQTHALLPTSPALETADAANFPPTDQRGVGRPSDADANGAALPDIGAYEAPAPSIHGQKFEDLDGDGQRDAGEPGVDGWTIELLDQAGAVVATAVTMSMDLDGDQQIDPTTEQGLYWFPEVAPGEYVVVEQLQAGWVSTFPEVASYRVVLGPGQTVGTSPAEAPIISDGGADWLSRLTAGAETFFNISRVWLDTDLDGSADTDLFVSGLVTVQRSEAAQMDPSDPTLVDTEIVALDLHGEDPTLGVVSVRLGVAPSTGAIAQQPGGVTADSFFDVFVEVETGGFQMQNGTAVRLQTSIDQWVPYGSTYTYNGPPVPLFDGESEVARLVHLDAIPTFGVDFGNFELASIHGQKFEDFNGNGLRDAGEPGLNGWTIELFDAQNRLVDTAVTMSMDLNGDQSIDPQTEQGLYWFTDRPAGTHTVREVQQPPFVQMFPAGGTHTVNLTSGQVAVGLDFGNRRPSEEPESRNFPAVVRGNQWFLRTSHTTGPADIEFVYGLPGDIPLMGDWDGDGLKTPGVYRGNWVLLRNSNTTGIADIVYDYGLPGDRPIVGDWDGDGIQTLGVVRGNVWLLHNSHTTAIADVVLTYGLVGDEPVVGDWDGDGVETPGVVRENGAGVWWLLRNSNTTGIAEEMFDYGLPGDWAMVGDWDGDGIDGPGVFREKDAGVWWLLSNRHETGPAEIMFDFGLAGDIHLVWCAPIFDDEVDANPRDVDLAFEQFGTELDDSALDALAAE